LNAGTVAVSAEALIEADEVGHWPGDDC